MTMALLLILSLLLALIQPTPCHVFMTSSSSHESNTTPQLTSLDSSHVPSSYSATSPPTKGQTGASTEGHTQELAGAGGHHLAMESGHEHSGESGESQDGILIGVHERKDLDNPSAHTQRHMQERGGASLGVSVNSPSKTLVPTHPGSHWDSKSRWNVSLTSAAPAVLPPEGTSSGTVQTHAGSDSSDKARPSFTSSAKDLGRTQETSPWGPLLMSATNLGSDHAQSSDITVAPVIWEKGTTLNKVAEGPHRTTGDNWPTAGSGDWPILTASETETSTGSLMTKGGRLQNFPAQIQTSTTFTTMAKAPTGSHLWPTVASSIVPSSPTPDFQAVYTPTAGMKIKQPSISGGGLGNGTTQIPPTTRPKVTEGRITKARGTTSTTHQPTKTGRPSEDCFRSMERSSGFVSWRERGTAACPMCLKCQPDF